jgi:peptide/nickel transport system substrate-binding protein
MSDGQSYWERNFRARSASRRRVILSAGAGAAGIAALGTVGCGDDDDSKSTKTTTSSGTTGAGSGSPTSSGTSTIKDTTDQPVQGGTWRIYSDTVNEPNDPTVSVNTAAAFWLYIGDRAIDVSPKTNELIPSLVEKWEQPTPSTAVMHIRQGAKWHNIAPVNGRAVTADDLATAFNAHAGRLDKSGGKTVYPRKATFDGIDKIEATDANTVTMTMKAANNGILPGLADWRLPMFPKEQLDIGFADGNKLIGSGPWQVTPGFSNGTDFKSDWTISRNASYWGTPVPYFDKVTSTINQDQAARTTAFLGDQIDVLATFRSPQVEIDALIARKPDAQFVSWEFGHWHSTRFNTTKAPWTDPRARRAIFLALDHGALGDGFYGKGNWRNTGPTPYTFTKVALSPDEIAKLPGWNASTKAADIAQAKQLMSAAGYPDGEGLTVVDLVFALAQNTANSTRLKDQLEKVFPKIKVTLDSKPDSATFYGGAAKLDSWDLMCASFYPVPDAVSEVAAHYSTAGGRNYGKYSNTEIDTKLTAALAEFNVDALKVKMVDIENQLITEMPNMTHYCANLTALYSKNVRGLKDAHGPGVSSAAVKLLWFAKS